MRVELFIICLRRFEFMFVILTINYIVLASYEAVVQDVLISTALTNVISKNSTLRGLYLLSFVKLPGKYWFITIPHGGDIMGIVAET